jgi:hypothetical protein
MKPSTIQLSARVVGTIFGFSGLYFIAASILALIRTSYATTLLPAGWPILWFLLGVSLARASYLAWFRWSPLAIRHLVGGVFFFVTLAGAYYVASIAPGAWGTFCFLGVLLVFYASYRLITVALSRFAFPTLAHAASTPNARNA